MFDLLSLLPLYTYIGFGLGFYTSNAIDNETLQDYVKICDTVHQKRHPYYKAISCIGSVLILGNLALLYKNRV